MSVSKFHSGFSGRKSTARHLWNIPRGCHAGWPFVLLPKHGQMAYHGRKRFRLLKELRKQFKEKVRVKARGRARNDFENIAISNQNHFGKSKQVCKNYIGVVWGTSFQCCCAFAFGACFRPIHRFTPLHISVLIVLIEMPIQSQSWPQSKKQLLAFNSNFTAPAVASQQRIKVPLRCSMTSKAWHLSSVEVDDG